MIFSDAVLMLTELFCKASHPVDIIDEESRAMNLENDDLCALFLASGLLVNASVGQWLIRNC